MKSALEKAKEMRITINCVNQASKGVLRYERKEDGYPDTKWTFSNNNDIYFSMDEDDDFLLKVLAENEDKIKAAYNAWTPTMLRIINSNFKSAGQHVDYEIEIGVNRGVSLYKDNWDGERYTVRKGVSYRPVQVGIGKADENGNYAEYHTIGFEKV